MCAGTWDQSCFKYHWAFAVNVAAHVTDRTRLLNNLQAETVPTIAGSAREFYIEPMLSCVGDYDIMYHFANELAIPAECSVNRPSSTGGKSFDVYEIRDSGSGISNYVYLLNSAETRFVQSTSTPTASQRCENSSRTVCTRSCPKSTGRL